MALLAIASAGRANAWQSYWAHQDSNFVRNGAITVKSLSGSTYIGSQNPTGSTSKANQNAATQAPTVIVQSSVSVPETCVNGICYMNECLQGGTLVSTNYNGSYTASNAAKMCGYLRRRLPKFEETTAYPWSTPGVVPACETNTWTSTLHPTLGTQFIWYGTSYSLTPQDQSWQVRCVR